MKVDDDSVQARLLLFDAVQRDLSLKPEQTAKIRHFIAMAREQGRERLAKLREVLPPSQHFTTKEFEARQHKFRTLQEEWKKKDGETKTTLLAILTPSQRDRIMQIQLQAAIPAALERPEIIKELDLSEEQRGKIREVRDVMEGKEEQLLPWPDTSGLSQKEHREKIIEFVKRWDAVEAEAATPMLEILTPEQRAKFDKLQGKKLKLVRPYDLFVPEDIELP